VVSFPDSTILMQRAEHVWINSGDGPNDNVNQLMALARKLLGSPKNLQLIDGDTDVFGDGSVTLVSTPGHICDLHDDVTDLGAPSSPAPSLALDRTETIAQTNAGATE
jgi:hypothetical protein